MAEIQIDLSNLREAIGDDKELEKELFSEFISSSTELLDKLTAHCKGLNNNDEWRASAHALKGIAVNLGASSLGLLAKAAQDSMAAPLDEKKKILDDMVEDCAAVVAYLNQNM